MTSEQYESALMAGVDVIVAEADAIPDRDQRTLYVCRLLTGGVVVAGLSNGLSADDALMVSAKTLKFVRETIEAAVAERARIRESN